MAKQKGPLYLQGTIDDLTFYKMHGTHLVRKKTSLNKERVSTDPAFANSRKSSSVFAVAAAIASQVYRSLPKAKRKKGLTGRLTGKANTLLHQGKNNDAIIAELKKSAGGA
ncbi:hypothetical protein [Ferruginibacter sp. SUN106]|uniref:hypothetical protein n=1 Tax=Ferruginibacter sp. SUN106 TaxID=2978348 RepID=UPI003D36D026